MMNALVRAFSPARLRRASSHEVARRCCLVTRITLPERDLMLEGAVLELGTDGAVFREAALYLFDRSGDPVLLELEALEVPGRIVATDRRGFRIVFDEPLDEARVRDLTLRHGVDPVLVV